MNATATDVQARPVGRWGYPPGAGERFLAGYAALFATFGIVTPYLQVLLSRRGFDRQQIGLIQGTLEVLAVLAPPLWGIVSDRLGRGRETLALAIVGAIPAFLLLGNCHTILPAMLAAILFGLFYRPQIALSDGITFRFLHDRSGDYGPVRTAGSVSFIAVIVLLERLGVAGPHAPRVILSAFCVLAVVHAVTVLNLPATGLPHTARPADRPRADWRVFATRPILLFVAAAFLGRLAMMSYYHFFSLFLQDRFGFRHPGYIWIIGPLSEMPVIYFSGRIMRRLGVKTLFALGLVGITVRLLCFSMVDSIWQVFPLQLLHSLTFGAYHTASVSFISRHAPAHMKSSAQTCFAAVTVGLGGIGGGVIGGWLAKTYGFVTLYRCFGLIGFVALLVLLLGVPAERPVPARTTD